ncbi:MAG: glycoside hydrolase family 5 protein [Microthrixaceae bacterium]
MRSARVVLVAIVGLLAVSCTTSDEGSAGDGSSDDGSDVSTESESKGTGGSDLALLRAEPDPVNGGRILDDRGREVLLRGVNVNSYVDYWSGNDFPTVFPFEEADAERIAGFGWNVVRLLFSWSAVEPEPGVYDEQYLDDLGAAVDSLAEQGVYSILDSHQDAWGPTLAARPDEVCPPDRTPANGWDGAPGWATLVGDEVERCVVGGVRETSPAVLAAADAFFANDAGPGGVGIRTRYADMLGHVAGRFASNPAVAGYDVMNEPPAYNDDNLAALGELYSESLVAIRAAEAEAGGDQHMVLFEPPGIWSSIGSGPPPAWDHDTNVVYSPHIYQGAFNGDPITREAFEVAVAEAAEFGGAPVLTGEWGTAFENHYGTQRTGPDGDNYFIDHQSWQDEFRISATIWEWRESCGDPHKVNPDSDEIQRVAGPFEVDCSTNEVVSERTELIEDLAWAYPLASPGVLVSTTFDEAAGTLRVEGDDSEPGVDFVAFYPSDRFGVPEISVEGLEDVEVVELPNGGSHIVARSTAANWSLSAAPS